MVNVVLKHSINCVQTVSLEDDQTEITESIPETCSSQTRLGWLASVSHESSAGIISVSHHA